MVEELQNELKELGEKLMKLDAFNASEAFAELHANEQDLLIVQRSAMINYHFALRCRIYNETQKVDSAQ